MSEHSERRQRHRPLGRPWGEDYLTLNPALLPKPKRPTRLKGPVAGIIFAIAMAVPGAAVTFRFDDKAAFSTGAGALATDPAMRSSHDAELNTK
jgi:hypothetical protein